MRLLRAHSEAERCPKRHEAQASDRCCAPFSKRGTSSSLSSYLSTDRELEILDGKMVIAVRDGKAYVARSDCGEQLCVSSAAVSAEGGMIVCLPNRVVIKIAGGEVDAVT